MVGPGGGGKLDWSECYDRSLPSPAARLQQALLERPLITVPHATVSQRVCSRLAPTHDCNSAQLTRMAHLLGSRACQLEIILHQHLP